MSDIYIYFFSFPFKVLALQEKLGDMNKQSEVNMIEQQKKEAECRLFCKKIEKITEVC